MQLTRNGRRALRSVGITIVALSALAIGLVTTSGPVTAADDHVAFGAYAKPLPGESRTDAIVNIEANLGRDLEIVRRFVLWEDDFPEPEDDFAEAGGRDLMVSIKPKLEDGTKLAWSDIASAGQGDPLHNDIVSWADRLGAYNGKVYLAFHHEPEATKNIAHGIDVDFVAAFRNVVDVVRAQNHQNIETIWIMTSWSFEVDPADRRYAEKWYPGDAWVDHAGVDAYNWYDCKGDNNPKWRTLEELIEDFRIWGASHPAIDLWLPEFGSDEHPQDPDGKSDWINAIAPLFGQQSHAQFAGILTFHSEHDAVGSTCDWWIDSSTPAVDAYVALGAEALFTADDPPDPPGPGAPSIHFVVADPLALGSGDAAIVGRLQADGYIVSVHDDAVVSSQDVAAGDAVIVSATVSSFALGNRLADISTSLIVAKPWLFDDYGLTASNGGLAKTVSGTIVQAGHQIASGLTGNIDLVTSQDRFPTGVPGQGADIIVEVQGKATLFTYEAGATLADGTPAPSCRASLHAFKDTAQVYSADGWTLFDATVTWAAAC